MSFHELPGKTDEVADIYGRLKKQHITFPKNIIFQNDLKIGAVLIEHDKLYRALPSDRHCAANDRKCILFLLKLRKSRVNLGKRHVASDLAWIRIYTPR